MNESTYAKTHSQNATALIQRFEGFRNAPYRCPAGVPTIGYGTTEYSDGKRVKMTDLPITQLEATNELNDHLRGIDAGLVARLPRLNQNQFDALVSFVYNLGFKQFEGSTLYRLLCAKIPNYSTAAREFDKWTIAGGERLAGLVTRRRAERDLFEKRG